MRSDITAIADRLIPKPTGIQRKQDRFVTDDIINEVLLKVKQCNDQLKAFAPFLRGATVKDTCYNVWKFWRTNITYIADDAKNGKQIIKSPAAVWQDKFCDCKSFAVAVISCLHHLGIKSVIRFVSFNPSLPTIPTHVYNVAKYQGNEIVIDCCLPQFDMEKTYAKKYDYLQPGLYSVTGVGKPGGGFFKKFLNRPQRRKRGELRLTNVQTEAELGLVIHEQRLELEQEIAAKVHGIGSTTDNCYQTEIAAINNAICECGNKALAAERVPVRLKPATSFIGKPMDRQVVEVGKKKAAKKPSPKKAKKEEKKVLAAKKKNEAGKGINKKDAKRLEKLNITVKKKKEGILKKVAKVITAPVRLVQKGLIEATLPKSAPAFLYLFLNDKVLSKAPEIVVRKRNKANEYADRVVNKVGMKRDHFMGIVRNGIMKQMGDTPENILAGWMRDAGFQIGIISEILEGGQFLASLLGGKPAQLMQDAPAPEDWGSMTQDTRHEAAAHTQQDYNNNNVTTGNGTIPVKSEEWNYTQATKKGFDYNNDFGYNNSKMETDKNTDEDTSGNTERKAGDDGNDSGNDSGGGDNTGLIIAAAVAVVLLASGGSKKSKAA